MPPATSAWTRSASPSRTTTPSAPGATRMATFPIDPSGVLPDGRSFQGPAELKTILRGKKELFGRCLAEKMLTYALGRGLEYYDKCAVDKILEALNQERRPVFRLDGGGRQERTVPDANGDRGGTMTNGGRISRRTVLRGLGTVVALPLLEAMRPKLLAAAAAAGQAASPRRMAFIYVPNGAIMDDWTPTSEGTDFELPAILQPLAPYREDDARPQRPDLRQGPPERRRSRRPCPRLVGVPDRVPGPQDGRGQLPLRHLGRPGRRRLASAIEPGCRRSSWASNDFAGPATATAATPASTSTRSPGARRPRRCRTRSIPGSSSTGSSPTGRTTPAG